MWDISIKKKYSQKKSPYCVFYFFIDLYLKLDNSMIFFNFKKVDMFTDL